MTLQSGNPFDEDLTADMDDNESFSLESVDLFEFQGEEDSPIARLKTIILSIDWEITDDILCQLEDELVDLSDIWADDKIKQIYIQGLRKIGKYIYREKANAHPDSIKLLITFFHNLEKISSSEEAMSEEEQKKLLLQDVKKFDRLKSHITPSDATSESSVPIKDAQVLDTEEDALQLGNLKAQIHGIDREISDSQLQSVSDEVQHLETVFSKSKAKLILLQGISALVSYINKKGNNSNSKSFKLLHSFYSVLEKNCSSKLPTAEKNSLLLEEVAKFKDFKVEIAQESMESVVQSGAIPSSKPSAPAQVSSPDATGSALPVDPEKSEKQVEADVESRLDSVFGDSVGDQSEEATNQDMALEGVDVETEADDDSDEDALPYEDGGVAPALAEVDEESSFSVEKLAGDLAEFAQFDEPEEETLQSSDSLYDEDVTANVDDDFEDNLLFDDVAPALSEESENDNPDPEDSHDELSVQEGEQSGTEDLDNKLDAFFDDEVQISSNEWDTENPTSSNDDPVFANDTDSSYPVPGVDVETEADDDSDEDALLFKDGELAPALTEGSDSEEIVEVIQQDDEIEADSILAEKNIDSLLTNDDTVIASSDEFNENEQETDEEPFLSADLFPEDSQDDIEVGLSDDSVQSPADVVLEKSIEENLSFFDDDVDAPPVVDDEEENDDSEIALSFLDDDSPAPALDDIAESAIQNEINEEDITDVALSFLDDEVSSSKLEGFDERIIEEGEAEAVEEEETGDVDISAFDETVVVPERDDTEKAITEVNANDESVETQLSFLDENSAEPKLDTGTEEFLSDGIDISEEIEGESTLSFDTDDVLTADIVGEPDPISEDTTDGEDLLAFIDDDSETDNKRIADGSVDTLKEETSDEIEFTVPQEVSVASATALAAASVVSKVKDSLPPVTDEVVESSVSSKEETTVIEEPIPQKEEIVFEAVADDVKIDVLPGEKFADSEDIDQPQLDEIVDISEEKELTDKPFIQIKGLAGLVDSFNESPTEDKLKNVLAELNHSRNKASATSTDKIFLQLLSTICQNVQENPAEAGDPRLNLMGEVMSGIRLNILSDMAMSKVQDKLLFCVSQVLLLKNSNNNNLSQRVENKETVSVKSRTEGIAEVSEEQLKSIVHEELANLKSTFLEEISTIREGFVEK
ncbi:hypothetical protein KAJ27_24765 [bacterium]|nr:hypothetical protein [bacterium]